MGRLVPIVAIVLVAAALRFAGLGRESLWYDELIMARMTTGSAQPMLMEIVKGRPPLYLGVAWTWSQVMGTSDWALRSLSATLGLAAVVLTYLLGLRLLDRRAALIGATLMAASAFQIHYSQEHRYYALYLVMSLASLYGLAGALRRPRWTSFATFAVFSVLAYYAQYFAVFTIAATAGAVLLLWRRLPPTARRGYVAALACIGVGLIPGLVVPMMWMVADVKATGPSTTWYVPPPWWAPVKTTLHMLFLAQRHTPPAALAAGVATAATALAWWAWQRGGRRWVADLLQWPRRTVRMAARSYDAVVLLACWWLLPLLAMAAVSQVKPMYVDRYLIATAPAMFLLIGAAMVAARRVLPPAAATAALLVAVSGSVWTLHTHTLKDQWREAAGYLAQQAQPGDVLAFGSYRNHPVEQLNVSANFRWYYPHRHRGVHVNLLDEPQQIVGRLRAAAGDGGRVWLVVMVWSDEDMPPELAAELAAARADCRVAQVQQFHRALLVLLQFSDAPATAQGKSNAP